MTGDGIDQRVDGSWDHYDTVRHVYYEAIYATLARLDWPAHVSAAEVGAREPTTPILRMLRNLLGARCHAHAFNYPECDLQATRFADGEWDVLVADQVLEHVQRPWLAAEEMLRVVRPGGIAVVGTPFILPIHPNPLDCWRIAPDGYHVLFPETQWTWLEFGSWGNQEIVAQAYASPHLRGFSGGWVPFTQKDELLPAWNTPPDNVHPVVTWWIGCKL